MFILQDSDSTPYVAPPVTPFPLQILAPGPLLPALQMGHGKVSITAALTMPPATQVTHWNWIEKLLMGFISIICHSSLFLYQARVSIPVNLSIHALPGRQVCMADGPPPYNMPPPASPSPLPSPHHYPKVGPHVPLECFQPIQGL